MRSLREKAERVLESLPPEERPTAGDNITAEERQKIDVEIEKAVASSRIKVTPEALRVTAKHRSGVFPLIVNLLALLVVGGGVVLALYLFRRQEQSIVTAPLALETAEGKLLEAVKKESREQLETKDREIADIRERLAGVDAEKDRIRQEATDLVATREQELQAELSRTLEAERKKLVGQGVSEEQVAQRIAALEEKSRSDLTARLDEYRREAEADRLEKEKTVEALRTEYEKSLTQAQSERARLQEESAKRQAELEAGYRQKQLALEQDKAKAMEELDSLRRQQQREQLVLDQILSFYRKASDEIRASRLGDARSTMGELRRYLDEPTVASLAGISRRRTVELFLVTSLEEVIDSRRTQSDMATSLQAVTASANLITAVASLVQQGDSLLGDRDYERARELYLSAMARIPAVQTGYARLEEIRALYESRRNDEVAKLLGAANASYRGGDYSRAVEVYGQALELLQGERGTVDGLIAQLLDVGARARDGELQPRMRGLENDVARLQRELDARTRELEEARSALAASGASLEEARSALAASDASLGEARGALAASEASAREAAAKAAGELESTKRTSEAASTAQAERVSSLERALQAREAEARTASSTAADRERTIGALQADIGSLQNTLRERETELGTLQAAEAARAARSESVGALRQRTGESASATPSAEASRDTLLALLETKLTVQQILLSDAILTEYPSLYDDLEKYLDALVSEKQTEARLETLRDLDALLAGLLGEGGDQGALVARYSASDQNALLLGILDKLRELAR